MNTPKLSIIILNYNNAEDTNECIDSLSEVPFSDYEILIVDNGSDEHHIDDISSGPKIHLYQMDENVGFARGCNFAAANADGNYLLFLNNDVVVKEDMIPNLYSVIEKNSKTAAVVPQVRFEHDRELIDKGVGVYDNLGFGWHPNHLERIGEEPVPTETCETPWGSGCVLLVEKDIFNTIGKFDRDYFMYTEDLDFSIRLRKRGYNIKHVPNAVVYHKYSRGVKDRLDLDRTSFQSFHEQRNRAKLLAKHYSTGMLARYFPHIIISFCFWSFYIARNDSVSKGVEALFHQIWFGLKGLSDRNTGNSHRWEKHLRIHTFWDYVQLGINRKEFYEGNFRLSETE